VAAYRRVYDSRHLQTDCQEPESAPEPTIGNQVWAGFFIRRDVNYTSMAGLCEGRFKARAVTQCLHFTTGCMNISGCTTGLVNYANQPSQAALERSSL